jgi:sugar/nucleoside kinase (ribokinase family)
VAADTMDYWIQGKPESLQKVLREIDILFINDEEAFQLSGETNVVRAGRRILKMGPASAVIKRGEHGAVVIGKSLVFPIPAFPLESVVDPTGAGDSFAGGFLGHLAETGAQISDEALKAATFYGTVLASFTVEDFGLKRLLSIDREQVAQRVRAFGEMLALPAIL